MALATPLPWRFYPPLVLALLDFGFLMVIVTFTLEIVSLLSTAFAKSCKAFFSRRLHIDETAIESSYISLAQNVQHATDHAKEKFNCHVGCVAWPFGKIKIATPLIKD